jgi:succinoglycan biosynthesis protein ExoM
LKNDLGAAALTIRGRRDLHRNSAGAAVKDPLQLPPLAKMEMTHAPIRSSATGLVSSRTIPETDEITVCICTYRRPELLERLLTALIAQQTDGLFTFSCVVVDNDASASARAVVERLQPAFPGQIQYALEPARNIALARNRAVSLVTGSFVAFIDDDEIPCEDWLMRLWRAINNFHADAVLGPVKPYFESRLPSWIEQSRICERPSHATGSALHWRQTRTGNALLRAAIVKQDEIQFDPAYASGGEDVDFFRRAALAGKTFVWCDESAVYELVPPSRLTRRYYLKRAFLQGRISWKYAVDRPSFLGTLRVAIKAFAAAATYTVALPVLFLFGDHVGMKYLIKDCHHISRLLTILGISRRDNRDF